MTISRREWGGRWGLRCCWRCWSACRSGTVLPFLSRGMQYEGFVIGVEDGNSYLAKMLQGREGHWL